MNRSTPLLILLIGVVAARRSSHHDDATERRPIITSAQQSRICADLCTSGLGGEPCGQVCFDLMPKGIPLQSPENVTREVDVNTVKNTRSDVCPVLCKNRLGYPLCQCEPPKPTGTVTEPQASVKLPKKFRVDFHAICDHYCMHQNWNLHGCPMCTNAAIRQDSLQDLFKQDGDEIMLTKMVNLPGTTFRAAATSRQVDWGKWCNSQCANSNGGSACNCDILPFSL